MTVRVDHAGLVTTIVLDRPEVRNAVDGPTAAVLVAAFADFEADPDALVAVLCGAGGTFCAGADLKAIGGEPANLSEPDGTVPMGPTRMRLSKPVIAAIAGHAVAGGLELALWCDARIAEEDAVLGVICRRWGVPLIDGGTVRLPQVVGIGRALDVILTGRAVGAPEAYQMGLSTAWSRAAARGRQRSRWPARSPRCRRPACAMTGPRRWTACLLPTRPPCLTSTPHGIVTLADPAVIEGLSRFRGGAGRGGAPA
jgi:enoyl-CoA hydratase